MHPKNWQKKIFSNGDTYKMQLREMFRRNSQTLNKKLQEVTYQLAKERMSNEQKGNYIAL